MDQIRTSAVENWSRTLGLAVPFSVAVAYASGCAALGCSYRVFRSEGLTRHEAVHAIGMVLAEQIYDVLKDQGAVTSDPNTPYLARVRQLTAEQWRQSGEAGGEPQ